MGDAVGVVDTGAKRGVGAVKGVTWGTTEVVVTARGVVEVDEADHARYRDWRLEHEPMQSAHAVRPPKILNNIRSNKDIIKVKRTEKGRVSY
jgi:hypothetical protein